jgi:peptidoglycan-N-acetylglucosamine deacetylase
MMIHRTPFILPLLYPSLVWRMSGQEKTLYLTFDDGPVPGPTEFVLHTLSRYHAHATFFCIGDNIRKHPKVFQKVVEDGHAIGNHTFNHLNGWTTANEKYLNNIALCAKEITEGAFGLGPWALGAAQGDKQMSSHRNTMDAGQDPDTLVTTSQVAGSRVQGLFRPPYGRITRKQIKLLPDYKIIMWDVLSVDYNKHLSAESCLRNTINACRNGSIIVFHDSFKAEKNMTYALPRLLEHFSEQGYAFKSITT